MVVWFWPAAPGHLVEEEPVRAAGDGVAVAERAQERLVELRAAPPRPGGWRRRRGRRGATARARGTGGPPPCSDSSGNGAS